MSTHKSNIHTSNKSGASKHEGVSQRDYALSDDSLRQLMRKLPEATPSPWFTRMVLNRLPEKRRRVAMYIEYALYTVGLVWMVIWGVLLMKGLMVRGFVVGDLLVYGAWLGVSGGLIYALVEPSLYAAAARQEARRQHNEQTQFRRG